MQNGNRICKMSCTRREDQQHLHWLDIFECLLSWAGW